VSTYFSPLVQALAPRTVRGFLTSATLSKPLSRECLLYLFGKLLSKFPGSGVFVSREPHLPRIHTGFHIKPMQRLVKTKPGRRFSEHLSHRVSFTWCCRELCSGAPVSAAKRSCSLPAGRRHLKEAKYPLRPTLLNFVRGEAM